MVQNSKWRIFEKLYSTWWPFLNQAMSGAGSPVAAHCSSKLLPLETLKYFII